MSSLAQKIVRFFNSGYFFVLILLIFIGFFLGKNQQATVDSLSSDVWMYQYVMVQQEQSQPWSDVPPLFNQEKYYLAYPILYALNPGLDYSLNNYFILAILIIIATYLINGLILKKIFGSWWLATLGAILLLIPRYIYPTNIGFFDFRNLRGLALVFPLYYLLGYYWPIYGLMDKKKNILLALVAAFSVYLYPPFGVMLVPLFVLTSLILYRKKYLKQIIIFILFFLLGSSLFIYGHFSNPYSGQTDVRENLTLEQQKLQAEIIDYRVADISLADSDLGTTKRSIWDGWPLLGFFLLAIFLYKRQRDKLNDEQQKLFKINIIFTVALLLFIFGVDAFNAYLYNQGRPPFLIEHVRMMRALGFFGIGQAMLVIFILAKVLQKKSWAILASLVLLVLPIVFFAPILRVTARQLVPLSIRQKYNLAPVVKQLAENNFTELKDIALWSRYNLDSDSTKVLVFEDNHYGFKFKLLSRLNTNLTSKEGALFYSSSFANAERWYKERQYFEAASGQAKDFSGIIKLARDLQCNYILLGPGKASDLLVDFNLDKAEILYSNKDYKLLKLN